MAVEIYQLNININVQDGEKKDAGGGGGKGAANQKEIVETCVDAVLEIIKQKEMR
ncbi:MAG: DUF5908 family protein [Saprospiraceae bacterium]|nr:DUF5908 family protein [Saprospiraceae bacterium]